MAKELLFRGKKSIELSMNFIVSLIISIVIFGFGIKFIHDISGTAIDIGKVSTEQMDKWVGNIVCGSSDLVCLNPQTIKIKRNDYRPIGLKILNVLDPLAPQKGQDFDVSVSLANPMGTKKDSSPIINPPSPPLEYRPALRTVFIEKNDERTVGILVQVPSKAVSGTYIVNINIRTNMVDAGGVVNYGDYVKVRKLYVEVP